MITKEKVKKEIRLAGI